MKEFRKQLDPLLIEHSLASRQVQAERHSLKDVGERLEYTQSAQALLQEVAKGVQEHTHAKLASVVTRCLQAVGFDYSFRIRFDKKRGKTEAKLLFERDGKEIDPVDAAGGGAVDLASFALRLAALLLSRPAKRRVLFLDEPLKHLSFRFRPAARNLIEVLSKEFKVQVVLITHSPELMCGKVIKIGE